MKVRNEKFHLRVSSCLWARHLTLTCPEQWQCRQPPVRAGWNRPRNKDFLGIHSTGCCTMASPCTGQVCTSRPKGEPQVPQAGNRELSINRGTTHPLEPLKHVILMTAWLKHWASCASLAGTHWKGRTQLAIGMEENLNVLSNRAQHKLRQAQADWSGETTNLY